MVERKKTGIIGEKLAIIFLKKKGYRVIETNYRCRYGEIDIICSHKNSLIFVEVRTKISTNFGAPEESITGNKKRHIKMAAQHYMESRDKNPASWTIDLVAIELNSVNQLKRIDLIENVIEE